MHPAPIARITLHNGALAVLPVLERPHREMVYRAATSVRWEPALRGYVVLAEADLTPLDQYLAIVTAVASEFGESLAVTEATEFLHVPESLQSQILALQSGLPR